MKIYEIVEDALMEHLTELDRIKEIDHDSISSYYPQRTEYKVEDGIAYIHIHGVLKHNPAEIETLMGVTAYKDILDELQKAEQDPTVSLVVLEMNSPGGESMGSIEVANKVQSLSKPVYSAIDGVCGSAAYKIASASTAIIATESSMIGSIGTIIQILNTKQAMNKMGVYKTVITNNDAVFKSVGVDFGDLTDEQRDYIQKQAEDSGKRFQEFVKLNRPEIDEETCFNGGVWIARDASLLGLIDGVFL